MCRETIQVYGVIINMDYIVTMHCPFKQWSERQTKHIMGMGRKIRTAYMDFPQDDQVTVYWQ